MSNSNQKFLVKEQEPHRLFLYQEQWDDRSVLATLITCSSLDREVIDFSDFSFTDLDKFFAGASKVIDGENLDYLKQTVYENISNELEKREQTVKI